MVVVLVVVLFVVVVVVVVFVVVKRASHAHLGVEAHGDVGARVPDEEERLGVLRPRDARAAPDRLDRLPRWGFMPGSLGISD